MGLFGKSNPVIKIGDATYKLRLETVTTEGTSKHNRLREREIIGDTVFLEVTFPKAEKPEEIKKLRQSVKDAKIVFSLIEQELEKAKIPLLKGDFHFGLSANKLVTTGLKTDEQVRLTLARQLLKADGKKDEEPELDLAGEHYAHTVAYYVKEKEDGDGQENLKQVENAIRKVAKTYNSVGIETLRRQAQRAEAAKAEAQDALPEESAPVNPVEDPAQSLDPERIEFKNTISAKMGTVVGATAPIETQIATLIKGIQAICQRKNVPCPDDIAEKIEAVYSAQPIRDGKRASALTDLIMELTDPYLHPGL